MGVKRRNVPHLKGLISAKVDLEAEGRDSPFTLCHALLLKALLHLKGQRVYLFFLATVSKSVAILLVEKPN